MRNMDALAYSSPAFVTALQQQFEAFDRDVLPDLVERIYEVPEGMALSVWQNKYSRKKEDGTFQSWSERLREVVAGSFLLDPEVLDRPETAADFDETLKLALAGVIAPSGRHLQHGDWDQPMKKLEKFSNCFGGDVEVMTLEHGPVAFKNIVDKTVTVRCVDGVWREAKCSSHGKQMLFRYDFKPANSTIRSKGLPDNFWEVEATEDHTWILEDGERVTNLQVGDKLIATKVTDKIQNTGIIHGLIFGDGSAARTGAKHGTKGGSHHRGGHKSRLNLQAQGATYCHIRLCGKDKDLYLKYFEKAGYEATFPPHAKGDACVYVGNKPYKDLPHTTDPGYLRGFIKGWWFADGHKTTGRSGLAISTINEEAIEWLKKYAPLAGYAVTRVGIHNGTGRYETNNDLYEFRLQDLGDAGWRVLSKTTLRAREVFCLEEPETNSFMLANGMMTGNCSTGIFSFLTFKLGLDGSGVGSDYSNATRRVNWDNMPYIRCVLDSDHPDYGKAFSEFSGGFDTLAEARLKYPSESETVRWFDIEDTSEGWVAAIAAIETATFHEKHREKLFVFNFSPIREEGRPIKGQQGRPASGPVPLMRAFMKMASIRGAGMPPWKQALFIDHYLAASTILGGVRRMARMATKWWKDPDVLEFIRIKRNVSKTGVLWTANHSILVDAEFWEDVKDPRTDAALIFQAATAAAYMDRSGEPGFINVDKLNQRRDTLDFVTEDNYLNDDYFGMKFHPKTKEMCGKILGIVKKQPYFMIVNPCSEISLASYGGYCIVSDVDGGAAETKAEFIKACGLLAKFLVRTNRMTSIYAAETRRTNRIGVSLLGIHEMGWNIFNLTFPELIAMYDRIIDMSEAEIREWAATYLSKGAPVDPSRVLTFKEWQALNFWLTLAAGRDEAEEQARKYSAMLGLEAPHTTTCLKPGGTVSKVKVKTESANLPAYLYYMRWVQYEKDLPGQIGNPVLQDLMDRGYPVQDISMTAQYPGKVVVGFPTKMPLADTMGDKLVTASQASPEEHYRWLHLLEKFWLGGVNEDGSMRNNMISYTLKFQVKSEDQPNGVTYEQFRDTILAWQPKIRCCAFDASQSIGEIKSAHAYVPEEPISAESYKDWMKKIVRIDAEGYDNNSLQCASGICPIEDDRYEAPAIASNISSQTLFGGNTPSDGSLLDADVVPIAAKTEAAF